ncbi:MAG: hypothetical protein EXS31_17895 [Pedosphaera sp.]|nr:hypothetical protein [Pedosphaera sp.]
MKRWAALTVLLYAILLTLVTLPAILCLGFAYDQQAGWRQTFGFKEIGEFYMHWGWWLWLGVMMAGQAVLLLLPLDATRERPVRRRRVWPAIVTGGFFFGNLALAGLVSLLCAFFKDDGLAPIAWPAEKSEALVNHLPVLKSMFASIGITPGENLFIALTIIGLIGVSWLLWGLIFHRYARADDPDALLKRTVSWLMRGSALELLIAVPSHVIARQRGDCCAPAATFWGITLGVSVMLLSFGPGVYFLFADRMRRLKPREPDQAPVA